MQWIDATECLTSRWVWEEEPISIWPVQRAKGQCGDFKPKVYHHAGTTSLRSQQSTTGIRTCHLPSVEPTCPKCGEGQHTLEHWLIECPALTVSYPATSLCVHRWTSLCPLNQLSLEPAKSITLAKKSLWGSLGMYASILQQQQQSQLEGRREMEKGGDRDRGKGRGWRKAAPVHSLLGYQSHKCRRALLPMSIELVFSLFLVC